MKQMQSLGKVAAWVMRTVVAQLADSLYARETQKIMTAASSIASAILSTTDLKRRAMHTNSQPILMP
jgi:positive regulator of sigma E activity